MIIIRVAELTQHNVIRVRFAERRGIRHIQPKETSATAAQRTARVDPRTGLLVVLCAIDNLGKGASGQAVQCANLSLGLDEAAGLTNMGVYP